MGFTDVVLYINSGNLIFTSSLPRTQVQNIVTSFLSSNYTFPIVSLVINENEYRADFKDLPAWWGADTSLRHNALFLLPNFSKSNFAQIKMRIGNYDQVEFRNHVILWTSTLKQDFNKSLYAKLMREDFYQNVSIRNRNTVLKLLKMI